MPLIKRLNYMRFVRRISLGIIDGHSVTIMTFLEIRSFKDAIDRHPCHSRTCSCSDNCSPSSLVMLVISQQYLDLLPLAHMLTLFWCLGPRLNKWQNVLAFLLRRVVEVVAFKSCNFYSFYGLQIKSLVQIRLQFMRNRRFNSFVAKQQQECKIYMCRPRKLKTLN